ncbi:MAG TPA: UrcA family protein [Steroidobacteraceae bacterium]|jgi:UrcA family protein
MSAFTSHLGSRSIAGVAAAAAVLLTGIGIAAGVRGNAAQPPSVCVSYGQLDLSRPADAQVLYGRLQQASSKVCDWPAHFEAGAYGRWQHCYDGALRQAVLQVNSPELLVLYRNDAGHASEQG